MRLAASVVGALVLNVWIVQFASGAPGTAPVPVEGITAAEQQQLAQQQVVLRGLDSYHGIRLESTDGFDDFTAQFEHIKPNFLYEAMFVLPVEPGREREVLKEAKDFLQELERFEHIPYYSQQNGNWHRIFDSVEVKALPVYDDGSEGIVTVQRMRPFEPYTAVSRYRLDDTTLSYKAYNRTPLYYKLMKGVKAEEMYITMLVKAYPGRLFFYGLVGANAFDFFGLFYNRLDVAFSGRAEAIFTWFHEEFVLPRVGPRSSSGSE